MTRNRDMDNRAPDEELVDYDLARNHALVIGIDAYEHWKPLNCAVADARAVARALTHGCGFPSAQVTVLEDAAATRKGITDALERCLDLGDTENLLIFYGGHGWFDAHRRGYWIPRDGRRDDHVGTYVSNSQLVGDYLVRLRVRHLLLISDCCFGGAIFRGGQPVREPGWKVRAGYRKPSRWILTSGDLTPVPDDAGTGNSPFATRLVQFLEYGEQECFGVLDLHTYLHRNLINPEPLVEHLDCPSHRTGGEFIFRRVNLDAAIRRKQDQLRVLTAQVSEAEKERLKQTEALHALDARIAEAERRLQAVAPGPGSNLEDLLATAKEQAGKREQVQRLEQQKRATLAKLEAERREARRKRFTEDAAKYHQILALDVDAALKQRAWLEFCHTWDVKSAPDEPSFVALNHRDEVVSHPARVALPGGVDLELIWIPSGEFRMGSTTGNGDERPVHTVRISHTFWLGKYEVTQQEYESLTGSNPSHFKGARNPVECVFWEEAVAYCAKLTERERQAKRLPAGYEYRLPSESEWEYACRAGTETAYSSGDGESALKGVGWYVGNSGGETHAVGELSPNGWGLYDMHGNVWEWCRDAGHDSYAGAPCDGSAWDDDGASDRVFRGGGWGCGAVHCRSAYRGRGGPSGRGIGLGFRVCLAPQSDEIVEQSGRRRAQAAAPKG